MIEIIALYFLCKKNGTLAVQKGLPSLKWRLYTVLAWLIAEFIGLLLGVSIFGISKQSIYQVMGTGIFTAFGGYLLIKFILEKMPDELEEEIKSISVDDLRPPARK